MTAAMVRIHYADGRVEDRPLALGQHRVGRDAGEIVLGDPNTSGRHAELYVEPGRVGIADVGSTNGTLDTAGQRLSGYHPLQRGEWVRLGNSAITLLAVPAAVPQVRGPTPMTAPMQAIAVAPQQPIAPLRQPMVAPYSPDACSGYSHPDRAVRHSYPVVQSAFGIGGAIQLLMKTAPFLVARLATLIAVSTLGLVYWIVALAGFMFIGQKTVAVAWAWLVFACIVAGWFWQVVVRYFLYLLKMGHIAVLTELITKGQIGNGSEGMFSYGKRIVIERFGQIAALFAVDVVIHGVVGAVNRSLDWVSSLIPVPGLQSVVGFVKAVLRACTRYIAETIFSYDLARGDSNVFRSSKDGLVYYAQNAREILKTGLWVVILERVLSAVVFFVIFLPVLAFAYALPTSWGGWLPLTAIIAGLLYASNVREAILRPLFLTMIMLKFHETVAGQPINAEWDQRLQSLSDKFRDLSAQAAQWIAKPSAPAPVPVAAQS